MPRDRYSANNHGDQLRLQPFRNGSLYKRIPSATMTAEVYDLPINSRNLQPNQCVENMQNDLHPYAILIDDLNDNLVNQEFDRIILLLENDGKLSISEVASVKACPSTELFRKLRQKGCISQTNVRLLGIIFRKINRMDLLEKIKDYESRL